MIELIEINNITDALIQEFNLVKEDQLFGCYLDNIQIGYAIIRKKINNRLFMVIAKKYQNKGYGSEIFKLLLSKVNESVMCSVSFDNIKMQRIIQKNKGLEVGRNGQEIIYMIDCKKDN